MSRRQTSGADTDADTDAELREAKESESGRLSLGIEASDAAASGTRSESSAAIGATRMRAGDMVGNLADGSDGMGAIGREAELGKRWGEVI